MAIAGWRQSERPTFAHRDAAVLTRRPTGGRNRCVAALFDHPVPSTESIPLALSTVDRNGGTARFTVPSKPVYVAMVYDEQASYDGQSPPPEGSPIAIYSKGEKPVSVTPGPNVAITTSFDDSKRWQP